MNSQNKNQKTWVTPRGIHHNLLSWRVSYLSLHKTQYGTHTRYIVAFDGGKLERFAHSAGNKLVWCSIDCMYDSLIVSPLAQDVT